MNAAKAEAGVIVRADQRIMSTPKRHHFVPEMLQKRFVDEHGRLYYFRRDIAHHGVRVSKPGSLFVEGHLYSSIRADGSKDPSLEVKFSRLESALDPIFSRLVKETESRRVAEISDLEKARCVLFLYMQWKRVPEQHHRISSDERMSESYRELVEELRLSHPDKQDELDLLLRPDKMARTIHNIRLDVIGRASSKVLSLMERRGIWLLHIDTPKKNFVIGSSPVIKLASQNLEHPNSELWLPISSKVAIGLGAPDTGVKVFRLRHPHTIRLFNRVLVQQSGMFAGSSEALLQSLANPR